MQNIDSARDIVLRQGWLARTPGPFQSAVLDRCRLRRFNEGDVIYSIGDPPGGMFGLVAGGVTVTVAPDERAPFFAHFLQPGAWIGQASAVTGHARRIGLCASRTSEFLHLPTQAINEIVGRDQTAWRQFAIVLVDHLDMTIGACDDLMIRDHFKRCVAVLLRLGGCRLRSDIHLPVVEVDASQEDIARLANVARTTLGAVLRKLEAAGQVELAYRRIRILTPGALRARLER